MESRDLFLISALLAIGTFVRFVLVLFGSPVTPNVMVAFYGLAIMLTRSSFPAAIGIGFAGGVLDALISSSVFNPAFLVSEPFGGGVCIIIFIALEGRTRLAPALAVLLATTASGFSFTGIALSVAGTQVIEMFSGAPLFLNQIIPVILVTAVVNALIAGLVFPGLRRE
jgi:hypothetical protein